MDWNKVEKCKHKNLSPNYLDPIYCGTPYCEGDEVHCLDCGVFISTCGCGSWNGTSGWPNKRWNKLYKRKEVGSKVKAVMRSLFLMV